MMKQEQIRQSTNELTINFGLKVPMCDGAVLSTDVYRPAEGVHPVILMRTPYTKSLSLSCLAQHLARRQFAVVVQSHRGRYGSSGVFDAMNVEDEQRDGFDSLQWLAKEPWNNGNIGLLGWSYSVLTNYILLGIAPPERARIGAVVSCMEVVNPFKAVYSSGALLLTWVLQWLFLIQGSNDRGLKPQFMADGRMVEWPEIFRTLPLASIPDRLATKLPKFKEWLEHATYDKFWKQCNMEKTASESRVPTLHVTGWFDYCLEATISAYERGCALSRNHALVMGPWDHGSIFDEVLRGVISPDKGRPEPYGAAGRYPLFQSITEWFDRWLRDNQGSGNHEPYVDFFIKSDNQWRNDLRWPPADIRWTKFYLESGRRLVKHHPAQSGKESYLYDPQNPVPTIGGAVYHVPKLVKPGAADQRELCDRPDVIAYTTDPLSEDMFIVGPIKMTLFSASTAVDTDFTVKLTDIFPDGFVEIVQDGVMRARYLESPLKARLLTPGNIYKMRIDVGSTAHLVRKDHRLGVMVSSSNFPKYDRNLNTGKLMAQESEPRPAQQTIYHGGVYASFLHLPLWRPGRNLSTSAQPRWLQHRNGGNRE